MAEAASPSSHSSFCEEVFSRDLKECRLPSRHAVNRRLPKPSLLATPRMRWTGQIFWLLAYDACAAPHLLPAFTDSHWNIVILPVCPADILSAASSAGFKPAGRTDLEVYVPGVTIGPMGSRIQLQQRNCSRFARDFLRRSTFSSSQRTASRSSGLRCALQDLFNQLPTPAVISSVVGRFCETPAPASDTDALQCSE
jgi:hypothetical protein